MREKATEREHKEKAGSGAERHQNAYRRHQGFFRNDGFHFRFIHAISESFLACTYTVINYTGYCMPRPQHVLRVSAH